MVSDIWESDVEEVRVAMAGASGERGGVAREAGGGGAGMLSGRLRLWGGPVGSRGGDDLRPIPGHEQNRL